MKGPVETKVAASGVTGAALALLTGLAAYYHWFTPPPPYLTALAVTVLSGVAGWLAPHTFRLKPLTPAELKLLDEKLPPATPPAATSGGA